MDLARVPRAALGRRRDDLARRLGNRAALIAAGRPRPRNYAANTFPFRAASHFLYFFGLPLREGMGLWDGSTWTLYLPPPAPDDALWMGPTPGLDEIARAVGCPARPLDALAGALRGRGDDTATLPAPDLETCRDLSELLGRAVAPGVLADVDGPLADAVIALRLVHDDAAQAELRAAAEATAAAHRAGRAATRPGVRESVVRAAMEAEIIARGMTVAYGSIVTTHGEVLHNEEHENLIEARDLILADVGAETAAGFAGDVTRTWPADGRYTPTQAELYDVVLAAQREAIAAVRPSVRYRDVHAIACRALARGLCALGILRGDPDQLVADGVHALLFPHGIGHLLGLDVHDMEDLGDRAGYAPGRARARQFGLGYLRLDRDLVPGMAVTIEPGLYLCPAILERPALAQLAGDRIDRARLAAYADVRGIRIEDDVLVTPGGCEVLTVAIPKDRIAIEAAR